MRKQRRDAPYGGDERPLSAGLDFLETFAQALVKGVRSDVERAIHDATTRPLSAGEKSRMRAVAGGLRLAGDLVSELVSENEERPPVSVPKVARRRRRR